MLSIWQIEGLRRLEIPEAMQKKHGFAPLGPADGPVKPEPSNLRYGYVVPNGPVDYSLFA